MALKLVVDAVEARLAAYWNNRTPIYGLNKPLEGEAPKDSKGLPAPFLQVTYPVANSSQLTVGAPGSNWWREEGAIRIEINMRRASGTAEGLTWADELAKLFRGKEFGGVQTFAPSSPVQDPNNDAGNFYVLSFAIPYQADILG